MVIKFGTDFIPVVFLTEDVTEHALEEEEKTDEQDMGQEGADQGEPVPEQDMPVTSAPEEGMDMTDRVQDEAPQGEEVQQSSHLSSIPFCAGVSFGVMIVGGVLGFLLAKRKIKKGIELYEDN